MSCEFLDWGTRICGNEADAFQDTRMQALLRACNAHPDFRVIELRRIEEPFVAEIIVADVGDGAVAQGNVAGINRIERIALLYRTGARFPFEARPLRKGFPRALHQYSTGDIGPPSLCIIDGDWELAEHRFTPQALLEALLSWLEKTADGTVHADDRALEPIFYSRGHWLMLPPDFDEILTDPTKELTLVDSWKWEHGRTYRTDVIDSAASQAASHRVLVLSLQPIGHPPLSPPPSTLGHLEESFVAHGSSLMPSIVESVQAAYRRCRDAKIEPGSGRIILLLRVPRSRNSIIERVDLLGLRLDCDLTDLGLRIQALGRYGHNEVIEPIQDVFGAPPSWPETGWQDIEIFHFEISKSITREEALRWSGIDDGQFRGVIAGVGSLGSALADIWARSSWGRWDYIDPDVLAQHNVVRHVGIRDEVGVPKVAIVQARAESVLGSLDPNVKSLQARASDLGTEEVRQCLIRADLIIDTSTTVQVPRVWAKADLPRSMSAFLTPSGNGSVLLTEDKARNVRGNSLEAQYYRAIIQQDWGSSHLDTYDLPLRSGASCRDASLVLAYDQILHHASLLAKQIRYRSSQERASIDVWESASDGSVRHIGIQARQTICKTIADWEVFWDEGLCDQLMTARASELPLETGGILMGLVDFKLKTVHVVDGRPSPQDSISTAVDFKCGHEGVNEDIAEARRRTAGMVCWIGAWHSHPKGVPAVQSAQDKELLSHLRERLSTSGVPAVMLIAGENGVAAFLQDTST